MFVIPLFINNDLGNLIKTKTYYYYIGNDTYENSIIKLKDYIFTKVDSDVPFIIIFLRSNVDLVIGITHDTNKGGSGFAYIMSYHYELRYISFGQGIWEDGYRSINFN